MKHAESLEQLLACEARDLEILREFNQNAIQLDIFRAYRAACDLELSHTFTNSSAETAAQLKARDAELALKPILENVSGGHVVHLTRFDQDTLVPLPHGKVIVGANTKDSSGLELVMKSFSQQQADYIYEISQRLAQVSTDNDSDTR